MLTMFVRETTKAIDGSRGAPASLKLRLLFAPLIFVVLIQFFQQLLGPAPLHLQLLILPAEAMLSPGNQQHSR